MGFELIHITVEVLKPGPYSILPFFVVDKYDRISTYDICSIKIYFLIIKPKL